jgi:hypothetical protein
MVVRVSRNHNGHNEELSGYTGTLFEDEFIPLCGWKAAAERTTWLLEKLNDKEKGEREKAKEEAYKIAKENQPDGWNPSDPNYKMANNLHALVAEALGLDDYSELKLYTSRGTTLDKYCGVDAFFEYKCVRHTLDLTLNGYKQNGHKANTILYIKEGTEEELMLYANDIAKDIKNNFKTFVTV